MRVCVLVASKSQMKQAGVRIRYRRIEAEFHDRWGTFDVRPIDGIGNFNLDDYDCYLISKIYDARSILLARVLRERNKIVGADLFDDYFSQMDDSRLGRFRYWLTALSGLCNFFVCSTAPMAQLARVYAPQTPVHVLNDPAPELDAEFVRGLLQVKLERARSSRVIEVAWFGTGDNRYFPVGLSDLVGLARELLPLAGSFEVRLRILTNARALEAETLARLAQLPIPFDIEEWSEEAEEELLNRSLVCFLPVNAQNFSVAKSLNRAISATCAGCQVFSAGFPLYDALSGFIYRDAENLRRDIELGKPALREETLPRFLNAMAHIASERLEAENFGAFLNELRPRGEKSHAPARRMALIHGKMPNLESHKFAQRLDMLSIATPLTPPGLRFDLHFRFDEHGSLFADLSQRAYSLMRPEYHHYVSGDAREFPDLDRLDCSDMAAFTGMSEGLLSRSNSPFVLMVGYSRMMEKIFALTRMLFPDVNCCISDDIRLPWPVQSLLALTDRRPTS